MKKRLLLGASVAVRLGPHVDAYTRFDETVYMRDVPSDKPEIVDKAVTALADFAGGLSLTQEEVDKERGVVVEEWRGGLGAGSRIRDKQLPVLFHDSRYAERLPIGKPEIMKNAPIARTIDHMIDDRFNELERKADAKFLGAGVGNGGLSRDVSTFTMVAQVQDGKLEDGIGVLATEAMRVREFGFNPSELDRAKKWM